jgi:hypothetical protein
VRTWRDAVVSVALHALIILLLVLPALLPSVIERTSTEGAGGPGPAGGGGGGSGGTGGKIQERLQFIQVAPAPAVPAPTVKPLTPPVTPPVVKPPEIKPSTAVLPKIDAKIDAAKLAANIASSVTPGTGGGSGNDGSNGNGPGTGGGVGSGIGTGRGGGVGPGTGGGNATVFPPTMVETFIPPMPIPERVKGSEFAAVFDVDSTGRVLNVDFKPTRDGGYNRRLRELLVSVRFRPATTQAGVPVRAHYTITYVF